MKVSGKDYLIAFFDVEFSGGKIVDIKSLIDLVEIRTKYILKKKMKAKRKGLCSRSFSILPSMEVEDRCIDPSSCYDYTCHCSNHVAI